MTTDAEPIAKFENEINIYEERLFGLTLFYDTMPKIIRWTNALSFRNMIRRGKIALTLAQQLVQTARQDDSRISKLNKFEWPPFTNQMLSRIEALLTVYRVIFPGRPMERLSKQEATNLRRALLRNL